MLSTWSKILERPIDCKMYYIRKMWSSLGWAFHAKVNKKGLDWNEGACTDHTQLHCGRRHHDMQIISLIFSIYQVLVNGSMNAIRGCATKM